MVVSYSESFFAKQLAGVTNRMVKCERQLQLLSGQLEKHRQGKIRGRKPTPAGVNEKIKEILNFQFMKDLFTVEVTEAEPVQVNYRLNHDYFSWLTGHRLGKTVLVSDQERWTDDEIISAYRGQDEVEKAFKHLKNIDFLHWQPAYHWTDQKLKVHGFYCVLGLALAALARKSVVEAGVEMTIEKLLGELEEIKETAVIYPPGTLAHRKDHITLTRMTSLQKKIASILNIAHFQIEVEG
jgi:transposase